MSLLKDIGAVFVLAALIAWEFSRACWCTFVLGQGAAEQIGDVEGEA
jgi:hypothetical protein